MSCGTFLVWLPVFYWLANDKGKVILSRLAAIAAIAAMVDFMFFGWNLGLISTNLQYDKGFFYTRMEKLINLAAVAAVFLGIWWLAAKKKKVMASILAIAVMGTTAMTVWNGIKIIQGTNQVKSYMENMDTEEAPNFRLSQTGQNVIVVMLDRSLGYYMPYFIHEKPELAEKFDGFTHYVNTLSYGGHTNFGAPALFGGYEYTPVEMNKRDDESLESKNDEALKVLPVLFSQNGYEVTVCDPPYAGYSWVPDLSIFDDHPEIDTYITKGFFKTKEQRQSEISNNYRNFFVFGLMRCLPVATQRYLYESGTYHQEYTENKSIFFRHIRFTGRQYCQTVNLNIPNFLGFILTALLQDEACEGCPFFQHLAFITNKAPVTAQLIKRSEPIALLLPCAQQAVKDLCVGFRGRMEQQNHAVVRMVKNGFDRRIGIGLLFIVPVGISK